MVVTIYFSTRVDADGDGDIDETELKDWIKLQIMDYVQRDAQQVISQFLKFSISDLDEQH